MTEYRTFTIHDNRICGRCGARQGACQHTHGQRFDMEIQMLVGGYESRRSEEFKSWVKDDTATVRHLYENNYTFGEIADKLNVSRGAVAGKVHRMKQAGEIAT